MFGKDNRNRSGLQSQCKECQNINCKKYSKTEAGKLCKKRNNKNINKLKNIKFIKKNINKLIIIKLVDKNI